MGIQRACYFKGNEKILINLAGERPKKSPKDIRITSSTLGSYTCERTFQSLKLFSKKSFCYLYFTVSPHQIHLSLKESAALEVYYIWTLTS